VPGPSPRATFYFDLGSPYAYLSAERISGLLTAAGLEQPEWQPVLRHGKYAGSVHQPDNSALLGYLAQLDRSFRAGRKDLRRELRSQAETGPTVSTLPGLPVAPLRPGRGRA